MMNNKVVTWFAGLLFVVGLSTAQAQTFQLQTSAGKRVLVGKFGVYGIDSCYAGPIPDVRVAEQPKNGRLEFMQERENFSGGQCTGVQIYYRTVYYIPKPGFRGTDSMSFDFLYSRFSDAPGDTSRRQSAVVTVR